MFSECGRLFLQTIVDTDHKDLRAVDDSATIV